MQEKIASKGVKPDKLLLFPNWADSTLVRPMHRDTAYRREWGLGERHVVLYSGNLGVKQGLHSLIDAANELRHESDIVFVIVGDGAERPALEQHAASLGIANVQFRPLQPPERLGELLATADVAVIPQRRSVTDIVLPSKLSNILAAARPVVAAATAESHFGRIIEESGSGVLVEPENPSAIALAILGLFEDPELRLDMGAAGRKWMLDHLGPDVVLAKFSADLERLVAGV
jgi:colanic acid biosynthesis glycosyl transferase WcaI